MPTEPQPLSHLTTLCPRCRLPADEILTLKNEQRMCPRCYQHIREIIDNITKRLNNKDNETNKP